MTQTVALRVVIVTSIERKSRSRVVNEEELRLLLVSPLEFRKGGLKANY